jgi:monovalent cation:H+ antiporter-2, CPA2 family
MLQHSPLISTIVVGLVLAFAFGALAHRLRISPLVGYLLAGVVIGPFTPGFVADQKIANELSEIGIVLLMFGVGLQFSLNELLSVRALAIPGVIVQILVTTALGMALAWGLGWTVGAGIVFGLALSVASTVVVLRGLQERRLIQTERGRIAVGWLVVEDIAMILALVLLPPLTGMLKMEGGVEYSGLAVPLALVFAKIAAFCAFMLIVGTRVIPWILHYVAHTGSRELFRLSVLAIALGVAFGAAELFDVSFALGAFFAGLILSESALSQRAAQEALPLRDAFAVLFFVSVGMLFDPVVLVSQPLAVAVTLLIIVVGKAAVAYGIVRLFGHPRSIALLIGATRAQIGEFSFILAGLGVGLAVLPEPGRDLILAGAIISILLNPLAFFVMDRLMPHPEPAKPEAAEPEGAKPEAAAKPAPAVPAAEPPSREPIPVTGLTNHVVLVGYGRVGSVVGAAVREASIPLLVIESDGELIAPLRGQGVETITGNAADPELVQAMNLPAARCLMVAIADAFEAGQVVEQARAINGPLRIIARAHSEEEIAHLQKHGASIVIMGEHLIAHAMIADARTAGLLAADASATAAPVAPVAAAPAAAAVADAPAAEAAHTDRREPADLEKPPTAAS